MKLLRNFRISKALAEEFKDNSMTIFKMMKFRVHSLMAFLTLEKELVDTITSGTGRHARGY
jgi:hypothetical protein